MFEELKFCEVQTALFIGGKNLGLKLDPKRLSGLKMEYDNDAKRLWVEWNGERGWTPEVNVVMAIPGKATKDRIIEKSHPMVAGIGSAQVETPFGHVHAGPGKGKAGK